MRLHQDFPCIDPAREAATQGYIEGDEDAKRKVVNLL